MTKDRMARSLGAAILVLLAMLIFAFVVQPVRAELPGFAERDPLSEVVAQNTQAASQEKPVARFLLFYGETCPHCHDVMDEYLPTVYEKYGDQVEYQYIEVWSNTENYLTFLGLETKLGVPDDRQGAVPALVIGDKVLIGGLEIPELLETYIDAYLAAGGVDYPSLDDLPEVVLPTPVPAVQILVIFDQEHAEFEVLNELIVELGTQYAGGLQAYALDVANAESAEVAAQLNDAYGIRDLEPGTPEVVIDHQMLVGMDQIEEQLPGLIDAYLAEGGLRLPSLEELLAGAPTQEPGPTETTVPGPIETPVPGPISTAAPEPTVEPSPTLPIIGPEQRPIHVLYFYETGCQDCDAAALNLNFIEQTYPQVQIVRMNIEGEQPLAWWLGKRLDLPEEERLDAPALFVGDDHLTSDRWTLRNVQELVLKYEATGADAVWESFGEAERAEAEQEMRERFQLSWGRALTVLGAGLINGLNPCAFVTIVFFLSYLTFMGRQGRQVLVVGAMFTLGVFIAYLLTGLGLNQLMEPLAGVQATLKLWVFGFTALLCLTLAGISLHDYIKARQGKTDEMKLKLSLNLRRRVNRVIREGSRMRAFYVVAFLVGAVISLIQLTCTSPIYIGILFFIHGGQEMQAHAYLYLLLFNLAYVVPLVAIFLLAYFGTSSEQLGTFITQRTAAIKLLTLVVFLVLFGWLVYSLMPLLGVAL